jgi:tetratricopeptide (TPR) repeat protein
MKKTLILFLIFVITQNGYCQEVSDYIFKAKAFTETGKPDQAINLLNGIVNEMREYRLYTGRAEAKIEIGDYSGAISDYNEANKIAASSGEYGLSRIYALKGDASTSLYHLELNLNSSFRKGEKEIMLDPAFGSVENKTEWRQFWKKEWYSPIEKGISEIEYCLASGKKVEAEVVLNGIKKNYPDNEDIFYPEALIYLSSGKYSEVISIISGLDESDRGREKYLRVLAKAQSGLSNYAGASVTYSQLIDSGVPDAGLLILRAECYKKTGETDKALDDIEKYLEIYSGNKAAISLAGKLEAVSGDNLKAIEYFSTNLKIHPNDPDCYIDRGDAYFISKSWDWAIKDYSMSLDLKPGNSDIWLNKGIALLNSGRVDDACHDFRKSFSMGNKKASGFISNNCIK